jgi:putative membrane protein
MWWYGNAMGGWGYALMTISTVLFWALIIAGLVALVRYLGRGRVAGAERATQPMATPEQVLARRFAAGEIDEREYRQRLDVLREAGRQ